MNAKIALKRVVMLMQLLSEAKYGASRSLL